MRELVKIVTIDNIEDIPGADKIEVAVVGGWNIVVQKDLYSPGYGAVMFEIDSCLPLADPRFEHLRERGVKVYKGIEYHRLKTIKLRGVVSQGMLMPLSKFGAELFSSHAPLAEELGILKYDDIVQFATTQSGSAIGSFPIHVVRKTDSERVQNLKASWPDILANGPWFATEKIDGCSLTVLRLNGELKVCSRNWEVSKTDGVFGAMFQKYREIFEQLQEGKAIQAEIAGPGVQGNRLALKEQQIFVFGMSMFGESIPMNHWYGSILDITVPVLDLRLPATVEEAIAQANGLTSVVTPGRLAEGVVWVAHNGHPMTILGGRANFKCINNTYLIKEK